MPVPLPCHSQGARAVVKGRERSTPNALTSATSRHGWSESGSALLCKQGVEGSSPFSSTRASPPPSMVA